MRNLKRALSLTLASVMLLGMMVVGSSAVGYSDVTEEENIEAIEVLQTVEVMSGVDEENFNPDGYVTREQMAVIMSKLLNLDYNYYEGTNPFSDVPAWAAPYVAACAANGITSGIGNGMYGAGQNVNAVQAALMMLKALGYFQYQQDFGDDYVLATVKQATEIGLFKLIDSKAEQALTRNEVAQMALNALQSDLVRFTGDPGVEYTGSNGESWIGGYKSEYTPRTSTDPKYNRLIDNKHSSDIDHSGQYYCQLGEELYNGNLVKRIDSDIFERPSYTWTYKTEKIGTYMDREKLQATYTKGVTGRDLYDLLNNITIRDYDLEVYVDGHEAGKGTGYGTGTPGSVTPGPQYDYLASKEEFTSADLKRSNTDSLGITADGVLTEVYLDRDNEIITVASIHTWLAQGTSAYSTTRETAIMKVFMVNETGTSKTVNVADVPEVEGVAADAFYLVRMSDKDTTQLEVVDIDEPEILAESTITKFSNGKKNNTDTAYPTELTADGTDYKDSDRAFYDADTLNQYDKDLLTSNTYNVYLDKYGYFIGVELCEGTKQYVFITGYDMKNSNLSLKTAEAAGIFLDGTMDNITVNVKDTNKNIENMVDNKADAESQLYYQQWGPHASQGVYLLNRWYTYTENNGVYTLKPCVDKDGHVMMLASKTTDTGSDDDITEKMNCARLRLDSVTNSGATDGQGDLLIGETMLYSTTGLGSHRAYGEDDSVFITVDVDQVSAYAGEHLEITKAITDVNGVYTGVQDVDLITKTTDRIVGKYYDTDGNVADNAASGAADNTTYHWVEARDSFEEPKPLAGKWSYIGENAYAVFDKNNFIIGAVILGEAAGNNATKAYILDPVKYERYENGTYYWQFEAVINGERVVQEAESKFSSTIDTMRNNRYEIVELRYNAAGDVVTDVKAMERKDTDNTSHLDKIYGYPFGEVLTGGHKIEDNETIYDVVLTGAKTADGQMGKPAAGATKDYTDFTYVTRPRSNSEEHNWYNASGNFVEKRFTTTNSGVMGTLRLQGRTLYITAGQNDYGIDFVSGAKAVVRQMEGNIAANDLDWENHYYSSVQEAIDALGDVDGDTTNGKQFRGIITAVVNSQGIAEWIVFYSDTPVETRSNTNDPASTMKVKINVKFGTTGEAIFWDWYYAKKPANGDLVTIPTPDAIKGVGTILDGWKVVETNGIPTVWDKKAEGKEVTFTYLETNGGGGTGTPAGKRTIRVEYYTGDGDVAANFSTYKNIAIDVDEVGYNEDPFTAAMCTGIPAGWKVAGTKHSNTSDLTTTSPLNTITPDTKVIKVSIERRPLTDISAIAVHSNTMVGELAYNTVVSTGAAAALGASSTPVTFDITYGTGANAVVLENVAADANIDGNAGADITFANAASGGVGTNATADGKITATINSKSCDVTCKVYTTLTIAGDNDVAAANFDADKTTAKVFKNGTVTVVFTAKAVGEYTAAQLADAGTTKTVTPTGSTVVGSTGADAPTFTMTHEGLATATADDDGKAIITVTFKVTTVAAATDTITIDIQK